MKKNVLFQVFFAIALAIFAGWMTGDKMKLSGIPFVKIYSFMGQFFLNALNLVVVPLVCSSIILGMAKMGAEPSFKKLGVKTFGFYFLTSASAVFVGLAGFLLASPWLLSPVPSFVGQSLTDLFALSQMDTFDRFSEIFLKFIPSNIFAVASQGQMLGLIVFSIVFGVFLSKIEGDASTVMKCFWKGVFQIMMKITQLVMKALPFGVFGLVAKVVAVTGLESITTVGVYFGAIVGSLLFFAFFVLPFFLLLLGRMNPIAYFRAMAPALLTAFSTSSSSATLPVTMECLEKEVGVSNRICSFSIPLGTSINMSGGALFLCFSSLFIAQSYGVELSAENCCLVVILSLITSMGIAGVPSASLISLMVILHSIGVPGEGLGLIMAVDRLVDMFRTLVNVLGNSICATLLARSEGEFEPVPAYQHLDESSRR